MSTLGDFTNQAGAYAARPSYPPALIERLIARVKPKAGDAVADLGAGTGIFTAQLSGRGYLLTAIEPNDEMRSRAPALPDTRFVAGSFEATGLASASQRWITSAQAFHWADPPRALPELARVLAPGGAFTVLWNDRQTERSPILKETIALLKAHVPKYSVGYRDKDWSATLVSTGHFKAVAIDALEHVIRMSPARYVELWRSVNRMSALADPHQLEHFFTALPGLLPTGAGAEVEVPYLCRAWTAVRADNPR